MLSQIIGSGIFTSADGSRYIGEYRNDYKDGNGDETNFFGSLKLGTMFYPNGNRYEGEWKFDKMEGLGKLNIPHKN